jgi:hypothetical protein
MQSSSPSGPTSPLDQPVQEMGLPPVTPPSGRHIVQMFLVPGMIVVVIVLLWLGAQWLVKGASDPGEMLKQLDSNSADERWRAANNITQQLMRDDHLASDPQFALRLADLLRKRLAEYDDAQTSYRSRLEKNDTEQIRLAKKEMKEKRKDVQFLIQCVGHLFLPTGIPLLREVVRKDKGADEKGQAVLRRDAVWSLANLGEKLQRFGTLPPERRDTIIAELEEISKGKGNSDLARSAQASLEYLRVLQEGGQPGSLGVIDALAAAARDDGDDSDPVLRESVALALNQWHGTEAEEKTVDETLARLTRDAGRGKTIELDEDD